MDAAQLESIVHGVARALDDARARGVGAVEITLADVIPGPRGAVARVPKLAEVESGGPPRDLKGDLETLRIVATQAASLSPVAAEVARWCAIEKTYSSAEHAAFELTRMLQEAHARERILERREQFMKGGIPPETGQRCVSVPPDVCLSIALAPDRRPLKQDPRKNRSRAFLIWVAGVVVLSIVILVVWLLR